jgi:hypothetical protein
MWPRCTASPLWLTTSQAKVARFRPGFDVGLRSAASTWARIVSPILTGPEKSQLRLTRPHPLAEQTRLRQHADRGRHGERPVCDARAVRARCGELSVDMNGREIANQAGK